MPSFAAFTEFKASLLKRHGLTEPDGRNLYAYRLDEADFKRLEDLLRHHLTLVGLEAVANRLAGFPELFVLYAAEWWRRRFGAITHGDSRWAWEPILDDMGAGTATWDANHRGECVRRGLKGWKLGLQDGGGLRYLGAIALQGGLPLRLLAEARGGIGAILDRVLRLADHAVTPTDLQTWVESLQHKLPQSYRHSSVYKLLAEMVWTTIDLKQRAQLTSAQDALARLDAAVPGWRERYPLALGDGHAQGLIDQLVRDAAGLRAPPALDFFKVERRVVRNADGEWHLEASLSLPETIQTRPIAELFAVDANALPGNLTLALEMDGIQLGETRLRRMAGHDGYRVDRWPWSVEGPDAARDHLLRLSAADGREWRANAPRGVRLEEDMPWVFRSDEASCPLIRQGGGAVSSLDALIACPADWAMEPAAASVSERVGILASLARDLHRIRGIVTARDPAGRRYRLRTGQAGIQEEVFELRGNRSSLDFHNPSNAYRDVPSLYRVTSDGVASRVPANRLEWSRVDGMPVTGAPPWGPAICRFSEQGESRFQARLILLRPTASLSLDFCDTSSGDIRLEKWGACGARSVEPGVSCVARREFDALVLTLTTTAEREPPEWVDVELLWPETTATARVRLPFPVKGVRAIDGQGRDLQSGSLLSIQALAGVRLRVLAGNPSAAATTVLEFLGPHGRMIQRRLQPSAGSVRIDVRLQDFIPDIQYLLAGDDRPDAIVEATLRLEGSDAFQFRLARYAAVLEREDSRVRLELAALRATDSFVLQRIPVLALRMEAPGEEAISLPAIESDGVATGVWEFAPEGRESGSWLIYPAAGAAVAFRPTLWTVCGEAKTSTALGAAIAVTDEIRRLKVLDDVIATMAQDFTDPCWGDLENLAIHLGHLPLTTLDLWRRLSRCHEGMVGLALRFMVMPGGFLDRFEQELPFLWEVIPLGAWVGAREALRKQCLDLFGAESGASVFRTYLKNRFGDLVAQHGVLHFLLGLVTKEVQEPSHIAALRQFGRMGAANQLWEGENSYAMCLMRNHSGEQWPTGFQSAVSEARSDSRIAPYLCPSAACYRDSVINLPVMLAVHATTGWIPAWIEQPERIADIRMHRTFDPDWFDQAFNLTIARCLADGHLDLEFPR